MQIYADNTMDWRKSLPTPPENAIFPCIVLAHDNWDDFGYKTTFRVAIYGVDEVVLVDSAIKIGDESEGTTKLPSECTQLPATVFSLWQDIDDYKKISELELCNEVFIALNDICFSDELRTKFGNSSACSTSLRRFSDGEKAYLEGPTVIKKQRSEFEYKFTYQNNSGVHPFPDILFDFRNDEFNLGRICALIGKNGVGKTTLLADIASTLSGMTETRTNIRNRPPFAKVIAVSYSTFDEFSRPKKNERTFSYSYCGLRGPNDQLLSQTEIRNRFNICHGKITTTGKESFWQELVADLLDTEYEIAFPINEPIEKSFKKLSSGQKFMVFSFSQILATIRKNSILLFDEPETHLHPNGQSSLFKCLDKILSKFDSYAILATHSPVFLQSVLSSNVILMDKISEIRVAKKLNEQSFGQHFSVLTEEIFGFSEDNHFFVEKIKNLIEKNGIEYLPLKLAINAINSESVNYLVEALRND